MEGGVFARNKKSGQHLHSETGLYFHRNLKPRKFYRISDRLWRNFESLELSYNSIIILEQLNTSETVSSLQSSAFIAAKFSERLSVFQYNTKILSLLLIIFDSPCDLKYVKFTFLISSNQKSGSINYGLIFSGIAVDYMQFFSSTADNKRFIKKIKKFAEAKVWKILSVKINFAHIKSLNFIAQFVGSWNSVEWFRFWPKWSSRLIFCCEFIKIWEPQGWAYQ